MNDIILDDIQSLAVDRMAAQPRFCLFWDVGVGKTYAVLTRLSMFTERKKILILAPSVVVENMWLKEQEEDLFDVFADHDITVYAYEKIAWSKKEERVSSSGKKYIKTVKDNSRLVKMEDYDVLVLDEAHRIATGTTTSRSSRIISALAKKATYVYCLTGTPAKNGYQDLYYLFKNAGIPAWERFDNYETFVRYFFTGYDIKLPYGTIYKPVSLKRMCETEFRNDMDPFCMFAEKQRTWELAPIRDIMVEPKKLPEYFDALDGIVKDINGEEHVSKKIVTFTKAYTILNGFQYFMDADGNNVTKHYFDNPKLPYLEKMVAYLLTQKRVVTVTYYFKHDKRAITTMLDNLGIAWTDEHSEAIEKQGKFVFLLHLKKGIGINCQSYTSTIIFYTYDFSFVDYDQTIGRIDRRGQENTVEIYRLIFKHTIESNVIVKALETKQRVDNMLKRKSIQKVIRMEASEYGR